MKYAVIQTGGKQYKVSEGDTIEVERLAATPNSSIVFSDVLLSVADEDVKIGTPYIAGMAVSAEVVAQTKGDKIRVSKFKAKSRYRRTTGHRQSLTQLKITQIGKGKSEKAEKIEKTEEAVVKKSPRVTKKKA